MKQTFFIIGMSDDRRQHFSPDVMSIISKGKIFSGGRRHYEIVQSLLPEASKWISITVPLDNVFQHYEAYPEIIVFASGDPLFFGFANTIKRKLPTAEIILNPSFNSLQMLAHRMVIPYQDMHTVSLTGRPWDAFDTALIEGKKLVGVLTDREKTPARIAARMLEYGYDNYRMSVGESLGNCKEECVRTFLLEDAAHETFRFPNCLLLERIHVRPRPFGIPESAFYLLDGRAKMITKMPVRLLTLSMLELRNKASFWDIGFCTGSVSVEAKLQFPQLQITAFEQRSEGEALLHKNCCKFGTPGITALTGNFMAADLSSLPAPDAVFIGGHGGQLVDILEKINSVLLPGGVIVFNSVSEESQEQFREGIARIHKQLTESVRLAVDSFNPIEIMKAE